MPYPQFDRFAVAMEPLGARENKFEIESKAVYAGGAARPLSSDGQETVALYVEKIRAARAAGRPVICAFGAHSIKNGLGTVLIRLIEEGWLTHLATNGAGVIHDWEFSYQGKSCEDVQRMVRDGRFGNWQETGFYINLALNVGAFEGKGYGESVGAMIETEGLDIPTEEELVSAIADNASNQPSQSASAADLLSIIKRFDLQPGRMKIEHPWKKYSVQAFAFRLGVPFTGHPMFGHDIIYNHPMNHGASLGRCAERDFLTYADSVSRIDGGVYVSIGSAVMSPMVFEKSLSISQNVAIQHGERIDDFSILVVDLAECDWDWSRGEPPEENPAYYMRYNKTFSRMGGTMKYLQADNRDFLLNLAESLKVSP